MEQKTVRLHPFSGAAGVELDITCTICRQSRLLQVAFRLHGDLQAVAIPASAESPARRHRLWEKTCLECFISAEASNAYWEVNLSPAGHWNVYRFDDYRQGMREEKAVRKLTPDIRRAPDLLCLECMIDLGGLGLDRQPLVIGVAAVLRSSDGRNTYWAAVHPGSSPDFHRREAFVLKAAP